MNPSNGAMADVSVHVHTTKSTFSFGGPLKGPVAKRSPKWGDCGGGMIAPVASQQVIGGRTIFHPNMRLKLVDGKWRSVPNSSSRRQIGRTKEKT